MVEPGFGLTPEIANWNMRWSCEMIGTFQEGVESRVKGMFKMVRLKGKKGPGILTARKRDFFKMLFTSSVKIHKKIHDDKD